MISYYILFLDEVGPTKDDSILLLSTQYQYRVINSSILIIDNFGTLNTFQIITPSKPLTKQVRKGKVISPSKI